MPTENPKPDLKQLAEHVTPKYAAHWKGIGQFLPIPEGQLDILEKNYSRDVQRCCNEMFDGWLSTDTHATWEKVLLAVQSGCKCNILSSSYLYIMIYVH